MALFYIHLQLNMRSVPCKSIGEVLLWVNYAVAEEYRKLHHPMAQENRTANLTTAALGYHHQSNAAEAHRLLTEAEALAPQAPTVQQAAAAIENAA